MTYKAALLCFPDDQGTGDGKIMKKRIGSALLSALVITVVGIVVFGIAYYCQVLRREGKDDLIPIEEITGINSQATLKPGRRVMYAYDFPCDDDEISCHCKQFLGPINADVIDQYLDDVPAVDLSQSVSNTRYLKRSQRIIIAVAMCGAAVGGIAVFLRARKNKHREDNFDE